VFQAHGRHNHNFWVPRQTVLIHNSGHFGPPLPFWVPRHCRGCRWLVMPLYCITVSSWFCRQQRCVVFVQWLTFAVAIADSRWHYVQFVPICTMLSLTDCKSAALFFVNSVVVVVPYLYSFHTCVVLVCTLWDCIDTCTVTRNGDLHWLLLSIN